MNDQSELFECVKQDDDVTNISQEAYDYLRDECIRAATDGDVMIIAKLLGIHEYDNRAKIIIEMNDLEIRLKQKQ